MAKKFIKVTTEPDGYGHYYHYLCVVGFDNERISDRYSNLLQRLNEELLREHPEEDLVISRLRHD
jgi:hypothetical protein